MNQIREIERINAEELARGIAGTSASWHAKYANSAWIYLGNLDHSLTEGDIIAVISQFGEIEDINLVRNEDDGKSRGFAFCKYEDARSGVLAVDNLGGIKLCGRSLRVDHCEKYRLPKHLQEKEEELLKSARGSMKATVGLAYEGEELANDYTLEKGQDLFATSPAEEPKEDVDKSRAEKRKRKEERRQQRDERRREREAKRMKREEKARKQRAKHISEEDYDRYRSRKS